jgi:hypothetical protein
MKTLLTAIASFISILLLSAVTGVQSLVFTTDSCKIHITDGVEDTSWDNRTTGNYWGNYNGTDDNGDGIGDTPYIIIGYKWDTDFDDFVSFVSDQDNYPLMNPIEIVEFPSWIILLLVLTATLVIVFFRRLKKGVKVG